MAQQISPLRQRMIDDMTIRNMSSLTQKSYIRASQELQPLLQAIGALRSPPFDIDVHLYEAFNHM